MAPQTICTLLYELYVQHVFYAHWKHNVVCFNTPDQERVLGPKKHIIPLTSDQKLEISAKQDVTHEEIKHEENKHSEVSENHQVACSLTVFGLNNMLSRDKGSVKSFKHIEI